MDIINQQTETPPEASLHAVVASDIQNYFKQQRGEKIENLYDVFLAKIEAPLLTAVMAHTHNNQSSAAVLLGLSRGTLRKKLKQHGLI